MNPSHSIIRSHLLEHDHVYAEGDFKILFRARDIELRIAESLFIHKNEPALNNYDNHSFAIVPLGVVP